MDFTHIKQLKEVGGDEAASKLLQEGWVLVAVSQRGKGGDIHPVYILGSTQTFEKPLKDRSVLSVLTGTKVLR